ncbi:MAG TPA: hypothetical protein VEO53_13235, partial [Candidatus Binatia bacterium]|nr:hypothetical protein [Candidatus Binatia bacterium]
MPSKFSGKSLAPPGGALWWFTLLPLAIQAQAPVVIRPAEGPAFRADRILIIPKAGHAGALEVFSIVMENAVATMAQHRQARVMNLLNKTSVVAQPGLL